MKPNPNEINKKSVGTRIKQLRLSLGLTLEEFGKIFAASKGNVSTWEKGSSLPNNERLAQIAEIGNLSVDELLYGSKNNYEKMWKKLIKEISAIAPGSIDQSLAFNQVLEIMNELKEEK